MTPRFIYLDNNATTRPDPRVVEAMLPYLYEDYGNGAYKSHVLGWRAEEAVDKGRAQVAALIGAEPAEIVFTSGATESDNLALKGAMEAYATKGDHLITCVTEHKAVLDAAKHSERQGRRVTYLGVDETGQIDLNELSDAITDQTVLVSVMQANNETGTLQPVAEIGALCRERGVLFHTDATQALGKIPVNVRDINCDLLSLTAHKMYGPKGIGALYVRRRPRVALAAQMDGGGHERGFRSGTLNVPGIVGFGAAAQIACDELPQDSARIRSLRDSLHRGLETELGEVLLNGHPTERLPNTANLSFGNIEADALLANLPTIALSTGSACTSASVALSHVLRALGLGEARIRASVRFGLSRYTTPEEIAQAQAGIVASVRRLRELTAQIAGRA